jgi:chorismate--pyruvate lyase
MHAKLHTSFLVRLSSSVSTNNLCTPDSVWHSSITSSPALNDWLFDQGSLTQRLSALCHVCFSVQPLNEGWQTLSLDECSALNIAPHSIGWVREVFLCNGNQPWVFARSVAGQAELLHADFDLSHLGNRSLGQLLFQQQAFSRGALQICYLPVTQLPTLAQQHTMGRQQLWARRSCFKKESLGVLVAEVFLPKLWQDTDPTLLD